MAQTRLEKIGSIYSRLVGLHKTGAAQYEKRPLWFDVYEAFPPKYEPRFDRHLLNYGTGSNVAAMGPPRRIFYEEDETRAKFYKVFYAEELAPQDRKSAEQPIAPLQETFDLFNERKEDCLAQIFIRKYRQIRSKDEGLDPSRIFRATVEALELDGIRLINQKVSPEKSDHSAGSPASGKPELERISLKEVFISESSKGDGNSQ